MRPPAQPAPSGAPSSPYEQGAADRRAWELWFDGLRGVYREGAFFWSGQRSLPKPAACAQPNQPDPDFEAGCEAAKKMLAPSDVRRKGEPDYRRGWNSI